MYNILEQVGDIFQGMGLGIAPPGKLTVVLGKTVKVTVSVIYRGPAISGKLHVAFGAKDTVFNEDGHKQTTPDISVSFGPHGDWKNYIFTPTILIGGSAGVNYDLYAKFYGMSGVADQHSPTYLDVLDVIGLAEFTNFVITDYSVI